MPTLLLKNAQLYDPASKVNGRQLDVLVKNGKIARVKKGIAAAADTVIDIKGKVLAPGFIDLHTHLREPGREDKETIATATRAAARGGFTTIVAMPNTDPVADRPTTIEYVKSKAKAEGVVNVLVYGAITQGLRGEQIAEMGQLKKAGVVGFSDDGASVANINVMRRAMEYAAGLGLPLLPHCEDHALSGDGVMREGAMSTKLGLPGIPALAEEIMIARDLALAEYTGCRVHITHIATARSVELIAEAKRRGVKVTCDVTPHHLLLTDAAVEAYSSNAIMKPALGSAADRAALQQGLRSGVIDAIATDHAPHTLAEKYVPVQDAAFGVVGLETAVPLLLTYLVRKKIISLQQLFNALTAAPAKVLRLAKGSLKVGADADLTVLDLRQRGKIDPKNFASKGRNTPFAGWVFQGLPVLTIVAGQVVMRNGEIVL